MDMGVIALDCITVNGTRLLGMAYESIGDSDEMTVKDYVLLVQSNPSPASVTDITWSLVSVWPRPTSDSQDASPRACHVDPTTGVFSMLSYFNLTNESSPNPNPKRPPGGLQYDPRNDRWSNFTMAPDYHWDDSLARFIIFEWPGTSSLFQANIGADNTINIGMLVRNNQGLDQFVNVISWNLDPNIYGYPARLFYGNNMLYQVGTHLHNNRTGALKNTMAQVPIFGDPSMFQPPTNPRILNSSSLDDCTPSFISAKYYKDTLYIFCQGQDSDGFAGYGEIILYKDGDDHNDASAKLNEPYVVDVERFTGAYVQPIEGIDIHDDGKLKRFAVMVHTTSGLPMIGISLDEPTFGNTTVITYGINITDSYGVPLNLPESNTTDTITGALIGGGLALSALTIYLFVCWQWPQWQRWLINRIVEILTADGGDADEHNHRRKQRLPEAGETNKVEDPLIHSYDFDGGDKILVIDDEMSTNLKNNPIVYVQDVPLERHPRPSFVTTLNSDQGISDYTSRTAVNHTNGSTSRAIHVQGSEKHGVLSRVSIVGEAIIATTRRSVATAILQTSSLSSAEASSKSSDDIGKSDGVGMALSASKPRALRLPLLRHQPSAPVLKFSNGNSSNSDKASTITSSESEETPLASIEGTTTTIVRSNHCNSIEKIELPTPFLATPTLLMPPLLPPPQSSMGLNQRRTSVYSISPAYVPEEAAPPYYLHQYPSQSITPQQQASKQLSQLSSPLQTPEPTQLFQFPQEKHQNLSQLLLSVPTPSFPTPPIPSAPTLDFRGHDLGQEYRQSRGYDQESEKGCLASSPQAKLPSEIFQTPKSSFDLQMNTSKPNPSSSTILGEQKVLSQGEDDTQVLGSEMEE